MIKPRACLLIVLDKGGVGIYLGAIPFAHDHVGTVGIQVLVKITAASALNAVIRPQGLITVRHLNGIEGSGLSVLACK